MNAKTTGYVLIAIGLLGIGITLFKSGDMLSGSWLYDPSSLVALILCIFALTAGVRLVKK